MRYLLITWCGQGRVSIVRDPTTSHPTTKCGYRCTGDHELIELGQHQTVTPA